MNEIKELQTLTTSRSVYNSFPDMTARMELAKKVPAPETVTEGYYLKIKTVNEDDTFTVEAVPAPEAGSNVLIDETLTQAGQAADAAKVGQEVQRVEGKIPDVSGFITRTVSDLANYYLKTETYSRAEVQALVSAIPKFSLQVVAALPTENISTTTIYLVPSANETDLYAEYIYVNGAWEVLGSQRVDLTGYATEEWVKDYVGAHPGANPTFVVAQTETGATITATDINGTTTAAITNGKDGEDGSTPVKGVDYFTPAEVEGIAEQAAGLVEVPAGGSSKFSLIHDETIELTEPVAKITKTLQTPCTGMNEFIAHVSWTANENPETSGNDALYLNIGGCQAALGDGSSTNEVVKHLIKLGDVVNGYQNFYEIGGIRPSGGLASNLVSAQVRYSTTANSVGNDTEFIIAPYFGLAYMGTIKIQIYGC